MIHVTRKVQRIAAAGIHSAGKYRSIIVELHPPGDLVGFRLKGTRRVYFLPVDHCYREAVRATLAAEKAERKKARSAK